MCDKAAIVVLHECFERFKKNCSYETIYLIQI